MSRKRHRGVRTQDHLARVAAELERCMKCGKCRSVCPVFRELQNELFSARGKIKLAEKIAQGEFTLTPRARQAIAECLVCRTCSVNCPSGVHVEEVILGLRWHLTEQKGLGLARRFIFRLLLQWRWPLTLSAKTIAVAQRLFLGSNAKNPLRLLFPLFGLSRRRNLPRFALRSGLGLYPEVVSPRQGGSRWRVGYFVGCAANLIYPEVVRAVVTVLTHHGCQVVIPKKQKCDGMPALVNGDFQGAQRLLRYNFQLFQRYRLDAIVTACSSCGLALKQESQRLLPACKEVQEFSKKVYDIYEFIDRFIAIDPADLGEIRGVVTYHDPCHLNRGQGIRQEPRRLLQLIPGLVYREMAEADSCCGSAGSYSLTHYQTALAINEHKVQRIQETAATLVATACPTCVLHIRDNLLQHGHSQQTLFVIELLAQSLTTGRKRQSHE